jgi:hypothetical protein
MGESDDLGHDGGDLVAEVRCRGVAFFGCGCGVVGWSDFQDVGDVDVLAGEAHCREHPVEEFARAADEGASGAVFLGTWGFADEHEPGGGVALAEDDVGEGVAEGLVGFVGEVAGVDGVEGLLVGLAVAADGGLDRCRCAWGGLRRGLECAVAGDKVNAEEVGGLGVLCDEFVQWSVAHGLVVSRCRMERRRGGW